MKASSRVVHQVIGKHGNYYYPKKITELVEQVKNSKISSVFHEKKLSKLDKIKIAINYTQLASQELEILDGQIPWTTYFVDPEDEVSLHRWNWMLVELSKGSKSLSSLEWILAMQEDWIRTFQHEVNSPKKVLDQLLRWEPYTISERLANSVLLFHLHNYAPNPIVAQGLLAQALLLSSRLEYLGKLTCNHVCNNARGLYLTGVYFSSKDLCSLAREIFFLELPDLVTDEGFLREGSSHYQFLFTRWMVEIHYFAKWSEDKTFLEFLEPILEKLLTQCEFFIVKKGKDQNEIPLFGDISPDFSPEWLLSLTDFLADKCRTDTQVEIPSWHKLWSNILEQPNDDYRLLFNNEYRSKSLIFPESGWFRFDYASFTLFIRCDTSGVPDFLGHHHQDAGHFCLFYQGEPLLVDGGRLNYAEDFGMWPEAHNTLTVNGLGVIPQKSHRFPKSYSSCKQSLIQEYGSDTLFIKFTTDGFSRFYPDLRWSRELQLQNNKLEIKDILEWNGNDKLDIRLFFHFSAATKINRNIELWEGHCKELSFELDIPTQFSAQLHCGGPNPIGWQVLEYGKRVPAPTLEFLTSTSDSAIFQSSLRFI
jgi:hypothetical protein